MQFLFWPQEGRCTTELTEDLRAATLTISTDTFRNQNKHKQMSEIKLVNATYSSSNLGEQIMKTTEWLSLWILFVYGQS